MCCSVEIEMKDGTRAPCAVKRLPYHDPLHQEAADAELQAHFDTRHLPCIVSCRGLFEHVEEDGTRCLYLATEYA